MKPSKRVLKQAKDLCKDFDVRLYLRKTGPSYCIPAEDKVYVTYKEQDTDSLFLSTLCHEVQHAVAYRNKKYFKHHGLGLHNISEASIKAFEKQALRSEKYVDKQAKLMFKQLFPKRKYISYYDDPDNVWYYKNISLKEIIASFYKMLYFKRKYAILMLDN